MISASMGEIVACLVRVPVEVVKQRAQAFHMDSVQVLRQTMRQSGWRGLYRGYASTIMREIPFSMIQFSLWEQTKQTWAHWQQTTTVQPYQAMICGSFSGAIAAFLTTPFDVAKTQIMLQDFDRTKSSEHVHKSIPIRYINTIRLIFERKGLNGLWAGAVPRVVWISIGGAIFLGGYEWIHTSLEKFVLFHEK
ncbi:S-adenosylmethionine mitochondrial carrier protein-like protein [Euroglyphus maynei]|uniref:S-adenosylmethionine mitochondrial carrier protein-like protein n=1 Tax=Euroglyphus maynei TaxID=6958 RepID=A0A1Y3B6Y8_EURMA|nr:S-adenosylmethionine mitochondrial carrier protein-like protein [Euroglyphus maynei]